MSEFLILRDKRLQGELPLISGTLITINVDGATSLITAFSRINATTKMNGKLNTLFILCHGFQSSWGPYVFGGGNGLQLGMENLLAANVNLWAAIKNSVKYIVVYACGVAYKGISSPTTPNVQSDGQAMMTNLAKQTNATVFAAERTQWYFPKNYDFGKWEGTIYMFTPAGHVYPNSLPVTEIMEILK